MLAELFATHIDSLRWEFRQTWSFSFCMPPSCSIVSKTHHTTCWVVLIAPNFYMTALPCAGSCSADTWHCLPDVKHSLPHPSVHEVHEVELSGKLPVNCIKLLCCLHILCCLNHCVLLPRLCQRKRPNRSLAKHKYGTSPTLSILQPSRCLYSVGDRA